MATNNATLAVFTAKDAAPFAGGPAPYMKRGVLAGLQFTPDVSSAAYFSGIIPRGTVASYGYTATTGIKVIIAWSNRGNNLTQAVKWGVAFDLSGATDKPSANDDSFPVNGAANEIAVTTNVSTTVVNGINYTTISVPIASIQNGQTTAPAQGDFFGLRIRRFSNLDAADTLTQDAIFHSAELQDY